MSRKSFEDLGRSERYHRLQQLRQFILLNNVENPSIDLNEHVQINPSFQENNVIQDSQMSLNEQLLGHQNVNVNERIMDEQLHAANFYVDEHSTFEENEIPNDNIDADGHGVFYVNEALNVTMDGDEHGVFDVNEMPNVNTDTDEHDFFDVNGVPNANIDFFNYFNYNVQQDERQIEDNVDEQEHEEEAARNAEEEDTRRNSERNSTNETRTNRNNLNNDLPLYNGAPLTVMQSMLMLLTLLVKHNISMTCLDDIIKIINLHCSPEGLIKNSLSKFKTTFAINDTNLKHHFYCTTCQRELRLRRSVCPLCPRQENSYFVEMSIEDQLIEMYERRGFYEKLQNRIQRLTNENISDIYDGVIYKRWMNHGFLKNPHNISFSWYTDGVPVFKSSQTSMWPIYLSINELPFSERKKRENTLLLGLWCGKKPFANLFLYKLYPQLKELVTGIPIFLPQEVYPITVRGIVLMGTADLIAKNDFMNFKQFNGYYGCTVCDIKGESLPLVPRGRIHVYPYQQNFNLRTLNDCLIWADEGTEDNPVMGIKGFSALSLIMPDYIQGMAIDRMHGVDGGVIKKMLYLLFDSSCRNLPFSLFTEIHIINNRLTALKPPKFVHRMPRSVTDLIHWKASELKMWCFYYSIPVLHGIMRQDYFDNYLLLVTAVSLLSAENITPSRLDAAEDLIKRFVQEFEALYGQKHCAIVIHLLLHLVECVKRLGPLWAYTCFEYENINGQLLKHVHGTRYIESQVINSHDRCIKMVKLIEQLPEGPIKDFCTSKKKQVIINENIGNNSYSVGPYKYITSEELPNDLNNLLRASAIHESRSIHKYFRLLKNKQLYISEQYTRNLQTNSSIFQYVDDNNQLQFGKLLYFIKITNCNCSRDLSLCICSGEHYAIIKKFQTDFVFFATGYRFIVDSRSFLHKCLLENETIHLISIVNIHQLCVFMQVDDKMYIGISVNRYELE